MSNISRQQRRAEERAGGKTRSWLPIAGWVIGIALIIGLGWWISRPSDSNDPTVIADSNDLALCVSHGGSLSLHIHPHLGIIVDGEAREIPTNIGVTTQCLRPMHTHDGSGVIHIESPRIRDFTLGQFFGVWGQDLSTSKVMDIDITPERQMKIFANQKEITTGGDTILKDHVSYIIMIGKTGDILIPPENFTFPPS